MSIYNGSSEDRFREQQLNDYLSSEINLEVSFNMWSKIVKNILENEYNYEDEVNEYDLRQMYDNDYTCEEAAKAIYIMN